MKRIPLSEAKARLSELVRAAEAGESILIVRRGRVVARLGPPNAWPEGVRETPVREIDLDALERDGIIRRPAKPLDLAALDAIPLPPADPSLPSLSDLVIADRDEERR